MIKAGFFSRIFILILISISINTRAQLADGSVCPDISIADLSGNTINIYDELNQGRSVIINVFAAWSPLSWDYHTQGVLQSVYETYGPAGTNTMSVIMIEGEPENQVEQISGIGSTGVLFSAGDWTSGITFPICDDANAAALLETNYYPTIYLICPDRRVIEIGAIGVEEIISIVDQQSCTPSLINNDGLLVAINKIGGSCDSPDYLFEAIIQNRGIETLTSATITAENLLSYDWTGSLETYAFDTVTIGTLNLPLGDTLSFVLSSVADEVTSNDSIEKFVGTIAASTHIRVQVRTDNWPEETSWEIRDENDIVVGSSESYATMNNQAITDDVYLQNTGCFTFTLFDSGNDGLNGSEWGGSDGYCKVYGVNSNNELIRFIYNYDGSYNLGEESSEFMVNEVVGIQEITNVGQINVYPNPTSDILNVGYSLQNAEKLKFELYNSLGSLVHSIQQGVQLAGNYVKEIDTNTLSAGVYLLQISNLSGVISTVRVSVAD